MRVAIIGVKGIPASYGGVERYTEEVATRLAQRGHEVLVYCRKYYTNREIALKPYRGVRLIRVPSLHRRTTDTLSHSFLATLDCLRRRPDVVVYHSLGNALFAAVPRLWRIPTVLIIHGQEWREDKWKGAPQRFFHFSEHAGYRLASRVGVIARWLQDDLRQRHGWETVNVSTGVTMPTQVPVDGQAQILGKLGYAPRGYLLFVGRLVPEKEVHTLLEAYQRLDTDMPLVIVGDTQHLPRYVAKLRALAGPNVHFLGFRYGDELATLYANAYAYVLPSTSEGIALTLLEAMAQENCVVISDIPQNLEAAAPLGLAFKTGDVEDLRRVLQKVLDHPELAAERQGQSREHVLSRYNWEQVADLHEQLYAGAVNGDRGQ